MLLLRYIIVQASFQKDIWTLKVNIQNYEFFAIVCVLDDFLLAVVFSWYAIAMSVV